MNLFKNIICWLLLTPTIVITFVALIILYLLGLYKHTKTIINNFEQKYIK